MKGVNILFLLLLCASTLTSQTIEKRLLNNSWSFGIGQLKVYDSYLSPFQYKGMNYRLDGTHASFYRRSNNKVSWCNHNHVAFATLLNPAGSSQMTYAEASIGYGSYYHITPINNLIIKVGGHVDAEAGIKYLPRNVNNIASADVALTLYGSASARYNVEFNKFTLGFQYEVSTPIMGCMFVPQWGQSYYEISLYLPHNLNELLHFSSFHNKRGVDGNLAVDLMFTGFTLRLGMYHQYLEWNENRLNFSKEQLGGYLSTVVDLHIFAGMKSKRSNSLNYY